MDEAARRHRILKQHVDTDRLLGVHAVPISPEAVPPAVVPPEAVPPEVVTSRAEASPPEVVTARAEASPVREKAAASVKPPTPRAPAAPAVKPKPVAPPATDGSDKAAMLKAMDDNEVKVCNKCVLCEGRNKTVFGDGHPDADLLFIGEGPGQREDEQGIPFVGRAGELLAKMIEAMGLSRQQVYIANVVKCRPPNNRTPSLEEVAACSDYLHRQIEIIAPRVIVTLGGPATKLVLDTKVGITAIRGKWHQYQPPQVGSTPIPVMPSFHPAFLLRQYTTDNRKKVWSDLQQVMAKLGE